MPKKKPQNAFYYFMMDFREEQRKNNVTFANTKEVADAAGPFWDKTPPSVRAKYEEKAKNEKEKAKISGQKFTTTGIPLTVVEQQQKEQRDAEDAEIKDIRNIVKLKAFDQSILNEDFFIMDVNSYCKASGLYLIGEFTILQFNLMDGIKNNYHKTIIPGYIPVGYTFDVKLGCEEFALDSPDSSEERPNYIQILANIIDYLKQKDRTMKTLPPIFTIPEKLEEVQNFIYQMCGYASEDESLFRIYRLDTLFFTLINAVKTSSNEGFPKMSLAHTQLVKDVFKYTPGLACERHESLDKSNLCTMSRVKRWTFTVLDSCCPIANITPIPGRHLPRDFDVHAILSVKEEKKARAGPAVPRTAPPSCNSSMLNDTLNETMATPSTSGASFVKKEKRVHKPLRMPRSEFSHMIQPAPELTEANFPTLSGHGRGRGITRSLHDIDLNK